MSGSESLTQLLGDVKNGDRSAIDRLIPLVYDELHRIAEGRLRAERADHTLQPTALVHEAYLRMLGQQQPDYQNRAHFFGIAARVMRQILVDHARRRAAGKRDGGEKIPLDAVGASAVGTDAQILDLEVALNRLEEQDPTKARLIELRYFGGLTAEESSMVVGVPVSEVRRDLRLAQAWLAREIGRPEGAEFTG